MDMRKEMAIQGIINSALKTEEICLNQDKFGMLFGSIIALVVTPLCLPLIFVQYKDDLKFAVKFFILTIQSFMCGLVILPLIFIDIAKVGSISMWYADKAYQMFKGEKLKLNDEDGEYEFEENRYEAWLKRTIASK